MAKTRLQKEEQLAELTQNLNKAKAVVFADYQQAGTSGSKGMTMRQLSELRKVLREQNAEFIVVKNTLLKIALNNKQLSINDEQLFSGPTATLFAYDDEITPIKALVKALKDNAIGKVKAGILGNDLLDEYGINRLATLPSKDELRGKTVGVLAAPLTGLLSVLNGNLRNLVYVVEAIRKSKGGE